MRNTIKILWMLGVGLTATESVLVVEFGSAELALVVELGSAESTFSMRDDNRCNDKTCDSGVCSGEFSSVVTFIIKKNGAPYVDFNIDPTKPE